MSAEYIKEFLENEGYDVLRTFMNSEKSFLFDIWVPLPNGKCEGFFEVIYHKSDENFVKEFEQILSRYHIDEEQVKVKLAETAKKLREKYTINNKPVDTAIGEAHMAVESFNDKVTQYALNQGLWIIYPDDSDFSLEFCRTTDEELRFAKRENRTPRYVKNDYISDFVNGSRSSQARYAVNNNVDYIDYDEWQMLEDILGIELSYKDALKINTAIWEHDDESIFECEVPDYSDFAGEKFSAATSALRAIMYQHMSDETCRSIDSVLQGAGIDIVALVNSRIEEV